MKGIYIFLAIIGGIGLINGCTRSAQNPNKHNYEDSYNNSSYEDSYNNAAPSYNSNQKQESKYINNRLSTGQSVYSCRSLSGNDSEITIRTSSSANCDLVAIVKQNNTIVRNAYIRAGNDYTFYVPNGTYQVFFYAGTGWDPTKQMPRGLKGGFVENESFSKDSPTRLDYQSVVYELILQENGNFSTMQSSESEIF